MKTLFMFPGQGAQKVGMGKTLADKHPQIADLYQHANDIVGCDLADLCFNGPEEKLNSTEFSQPAIFTASAAALLALRSGLLDVISTGGAAKRIHELGGGEHHDAPPPSPVLTPDACAGLSLGEYTALYAAEAMTFADALTLVKLRGKSMQDAADAYQGSMVSILGLDSDAVQNLCDSILNELNVNSPRRQPGDDATTPTGGSHRVEDEVDGSKTSAQSCHSERSEESQPVAQPPSAVQTEILIPVNFNCPGQIVLSGTLNACKLAAEKAESFGASHAVPLAVAGAFHSPMMIPAAEKLRRALERISFSPPTCPVLANVDALPYDSTDQIPDKLIRQLTSPVLFQQTIEKLLHDGFERFVEIGPGRILTGLVKKTARPLKLKPSLITLNT